MAAPVAAAGPLLKVDLCEDRVACVGVDVSVPAQLGRPAVQIGPTPRLGSVRLRACGAGVCGAASAETYILFYSILVL